MDWRRMPSIYVVGIRHPPATMIKIIYDAIEENVELVYFED
jgi:hypothetical protein